VFCFEPALIVLIHSVISRSPLALRSTVDEEEEEVVGMKSHKKHRKLDFSGEGMSGLLLRLVCVQPVSHRTILILSLNLTLPVSPVT
jgi:hypothetical protein